MQSMREAPNRVKMALCLLCLLRGARGESDSASGKPSEVRAGILEELKREFRFEPQQSVVQPTTDGEVIVLPRFAVIDSRKGANQAIRDERKKIEDEKFSWKNGGTILKLGPMKVMFKYDPETNLLYLLRF